MTSPPPLSEGPVPRRFSLALLLVILNGVMFLGEEMAQRFLHWPLTHWLALSVDGLKAGYFWQLLTFQFLHGGWIHLFLNSWALFLFGQELEFFLGRASFLKLYLLSGVAGGLVQIFCALALPEHFGGALVGASAGVFGLLAAFAALFPERQITLLLFFILPLTLRAKTLLFWGVLLAIAGTLMPDDHIAHAAHLGGILGGLAYLNWTRSKPEVS